MQGSRRDGFHRSKVAACMALFLVLATIPVALARAEPAPPPPSLEPVQFVPLTQTIFVGMSEIPEDISKIVGPAPEVSHGGLGT